MELVLRACHAGLDFHEELLLEHGAVPQTGDDFFEASGFVELGLLVPCGGEQNDLALVIKTRPACSARALPNGVRGERGEFPVIVALKVVKDDLPGREVQTHLQCASGNENGSFISPKGFLDAAALAMKKSGMMEIRRNSLGAKMLGKPFAASAALHEDETLQPPVAGVCGFAAEEFWFLLRVAKPLDAPLERNRSPRRTKLHTFQPIREFPTVPKRGGKAEDADKRVQPAQSGNRALQAGSPVRIAQEVDLINHHEVDLRNPRPMRAPVPGAGIKPLGGHDQEVRIVVGRGNVAALGAVVAGENPDLEAGKFEGPFVGEFLGECPERAQVNGPVAGLEGFAERQRGEPGFAAPRGHLEDAAEPGIKESVVDDFLLGGIEGCVHSCGRDKHGGAITARKKLKTCGFR